MADYKLIINPATGKLQKVHSDEYIRATGAGLNFKSGVDTSGDLPSEGNSKHDARITQDEHHLYVWDGTAWQDQGDIFDIDWSNVENKPSSSVSNIDDAVDKRHTQNSDTILDEGGDNEVTATDAADAVSKKHTQDSDTKLAEGTGDEVTAADAADTVDKRHTQNSDTILDEGGDNEVNASELNTHIGDTSSNPHSVNEFSADKVKYEDKSSETDGSTTDFTLNNTPIENSVQVFQAGSLKNKDVGVEPVLLIPADGSDGATDFEDSSPSNHSITANGSAQKDTSDKKFGTASCYVVSSSDQLSITDSDDFYFGTGAFTIEMFFKQENTVDNIKFYRHFQDAENNFLILMWGGVFCINIDSGGTRIGYYYSPWGETVFSSDTWHHLAVTRQDSSGLQAFADGQEISMTEATRLGSASIPNLSANLIVARGDTDNNAWFDEIRVVKGQALYTSNFTPPTEPYSYVSGDYGFSGDTISFDAAPAGVDDLIVYYMTE